MEDNKNGSVSSTPLDSTHPLIGYSLARKKFAKLHFEQFLLLCKRAKIDTVELYGDYFDRSNDRIPDLIIHKLEEDSSSLRLIDEIRSLTSKSTILLDPFESIAKLLDRFDQYSLLNSKRQIYIVPNFIRVQLDDNPTMIERRLFDNRISFPVLCKPIQAHGEKSHLMKIIFNREHLIDVEPPCVLQQFIDHDGVLFKIFAIGPENFHVVERNSIRNLKNYLSNETICFHSSEVSSSQADHILLSTDPSIKIPANDVLMKKIARTVQSLFELNLVGIDIIVDRQTGDYAVIDVNYFPGYEGVKDFNSELFDLCQHLLRHC